MVQIKYTVNLIVLIILLVRTVKVLSRDLVERERALRAEFIHNLLNKHDKLEGKIKLMGGLSNHEGNVYIYHAGRWGAVCDDSWDDEAAAVVCKSFNMTGVATVGGSYGHTVEKYWLDDVICQGDEPMLSKCVFNRWGASDCETDEAAGVICMEEHDSPKNTQSAEKKRSERKLRSILNEKTAKLRIVGGNNVNEGRVEIFHNNTWGSICPDAWTNYEAAVVCKHLDLGFAEKALQTYIYGFSKIAISGVKCEGNETNFFDCGIRLQRHDEPVTCPGDIGHAAAIVCTNKLADLVLDTTAIEKSAHLIDVMMYQLRCAMEENCLSRSAYEVKVLIPDWQFETRRLLRFTAASLNAGNAEFRPYLPKHLWQWHLCHMHYHSMEVFATFDILDSNGQRVAEGHKASFCLEDNTCNEGVKKKYSCKNYGDQGISVNCSDVYQFNIDCQWVDVTDVQPGNYKFKVAVNPHARIAEQSFHNNAAHCLLTLTTTNARVYGCTLGRP